MNALFHKMAEMTRRTKKMKKLTILGHNLSHIDSNVLAKVFMQVEELEFDGLMLSAEQTAAIFHT